MSKDLCGIGCLEVNRDQNHHETEADPADGHKRNMKTLA
jgi:hypothetical protein